MYEGEIDWFVVVGNILFGGEKWWSILCLSGKIWGITFLLTTCFWPPSELIIFRLNTFFTGEMCLGLRSLSSSLCQPCFRLLTSFFLTISLSRKTGDIRHDIASIDERIIMATVWLIDVVRSGVALELALLLLLVNSPLLLLCCCVFLWLRSGAGRVSQCHTAMISGLNIFIISSQIYLTSLTLNTNNTKCKNPRLEVYGKFIEMCQAM